MPWTYNVVHGNTIQPRPSYHKALTYAVELAESIARGKSHGKVKVAVVAFNGKRTQLIEVTR